MAGNTATDGMWKRIQQSHCSVKPRAKTICKMSNNATLLAKFFCFGKHSY